MNCDIYEKNKFHQRTKVAVIDGRIQKKGFTLSMRAIYSMGVTFFSKIALASEFPDPVLSFHQAWFIDKQVASPPLMAESDWVQVDLIDDWYRNHGGSPNPAWYRVDFTVESTVEKLWSVYLPAVNSNAVVWLNGEIIGDGGSMATPPARNWHRPLYFTVPRNLIKQGSNSLSIHFLPKYSGFGFLGAIHIGPDLLLRPAYEMRYLLKQTFIGASTVLLSIFSIFVGLLWLMRRKETLCLWFAAGSFFWSFFVFDMFIKYIPVQERLWDTLVFSSVGWLVIFMSIFFHRFLGLNRPQLERGMLIFGGLGTVLLYQSGNRYFYFFSSYIWDNLLIFFCVYMIWIIVSQCLRKPSKEAWLLSIALIVVVSFGGYDNLVQMGYLELDHVRLLPYGAPFLLGVLVWMLAQRYVKALHVSEQLNRELDFHVIEKSRELEERYREIKKIEKEKILVVERERIMRDMHDGTGGHLVAALAQVEKGSINKSVLMGTLQNALDDIRLMIDSLDPVDEDVVSVLAMLRSRLESRLHYSGIRVKWMVQDVPAIPGFGPEKVLQLMHILHEAVTNIIKHAQADTITFRTGIIESSKSKKPIYIEIEDNGKGFSYDSQEGRGFANMYHRAASIDVCLEISNNDQGAIVRVLLPVSFQVK